MTTLEQLEEKYKVTFPNIYRKLFEADMLDWMRGFDYPLKDGITWAKDIYPTLKANPPALLHSGGSDFELFTPKDILDFEQPETWDSRTHHFIPFAKTDEGNVYAFYANIEINKQNPIVLIWRDDETEYVAKNFEDFIFRKMLEAGNDIDKDDLQADYGKNNSIEIYRTDLLSDLKSITPYLNTEHAEILEELYNAPAIEMTFSYGFESKREFSDIFKKYLDFEYMANVFDHEIP